MNSEVSTNGVCSDEISSLYHAWLCDVASPVPSWHDDDDDDDDCLSRLGSVTE